MDYSSHLRRIAGALLGGWLFICQVAIAQPADTLQILILHSYDANTEPYVSTTESFRRQMRAQLSGPIAFREMGLEARRDSGDGREELIEDLLKNLYQTRPPDLIAAIGPPAVSYWLRHRDRLFADVPFIAAAGEGRFFQSDLRPGDFGIVTRLDFRDFIENILRLKPDTSDILVILGATPYEHSLATFMQSQLVDLAQQINFEYTNDLTLTELLARVGQLGEHHAVFYGLFNTDPAGVTLHDGSALPMVRQASKVPVFGTLENQLGRGIVGGPLIQLELLGAKMAEAASHLLRDPPDKAGWNTIELSAPRFDWRELQFFRIDSDRLPPGSEFRFKPQSPWVRFAGWLALGGAIIMAQSLLIIALLIEHRRRRHAESAQVSLSGKLITAYEDERRRIARELHDDLSQRLARLAMDVGAMKRQEESAPNTAGFEQFHHDIASISKDCHDISYRLHPSLLDDLGIVTALRSECERVSRQSSTTVIEDIDEIPEKLDKDAALCLYRIAQEALNNAIKHADARAIEVALHQEKNVVTVSIQDNGKGFSITEKDYAVGLGLSSMRERSRLLDAALIIDSHPGSGTTVSVSIPLRGKSQ